LTIPSYKDVDLALLLELVRARRSVRPSETYASVAKHFPDLTDEDLAKTRQDGRTKVFNNMIHWARDHLRRRGLLLDVIAQWEVTHQALEVLVDDLEKRGASRGRAETFIGRTDGLPDLLGRNWARAVRSGGARGPTARSSSAAGAHAQEELTRESGERPSQVENGAIERDVLARLGRMDGYEFEQFVGRLLDSVGFKDTRVMGRSGDEGMDVLTFLPSPFVTAKVAVQVKRHSANVGPKDISYLRDRWAKRADKLLFITTSDYTQGAREVATDDREAQVELVNGEQLVAVMVQHQLGVKAQPLVAYEVDEEYFSNI
jgi:restriction endonuclease Mrr